MNSVLPGPLDGLRAVVLTQAWSGTFATELLGFLGAEVIQVEAQRRLDSWRGSFTGSPAALRDTPTAIHPWNCSPLYNAVNLNKEAITLDLSRAEGRDVFRQLVLTADIVAENFTPRVMANLGLDYNSLTVLRPDVILLSISAYGATGPYANTPGIGGTIEPMSGMSSLLGYEGGAPTNSGQMYPDPVAGYFGAAALLIALHHRERTGRGQYIDLSMQETSMSFIADALMDFSANGTVREPMGNHHPHIAPHNVYPCTLPNRWIAIAAADDVEFSKLAAVAGHPEWVSDPRFASAEARKCNEAELDAAVAAWTANHDAFALERVLHGAGVTAAAVRNAAEVQEVDQLRQRGMLTPVQHPEAGTHVYAAQPWLLSRTPGGVRLPAPGLGEHSRSVFKRLLGLDDAACDQLEASGISGTEPQR